MNRHDLRKFRQQVLGLTQAELASHLRLARMTITRYEAGTRRIPGVVEVAVHQLMAKQTVAAHVPMAGVVAAGKPIEPAPQHETVDIPPSLVRRPGQCFALRVSGDSMRDEGILPGDLIIVQRQPAARSGQVVVASVNGEATVKKFFHIANRIELRPANPVMRPILVGAKDEFRIDGIVIGVIRAYA